jgi:hypothetical protein
MAYYLNTYRLAFKNVEGDTTNVYIQDTSTTVASFLDQTITELEGGENPLVIRSVDSSEDKFTPIRAKEAIITLRATNNVHLIHFTGADDRWRVYVEISGTTIFSGFLVMDDMIMPLQPPENSELTLVATDQLGTLKDVEWTDFAGAVPRGKYSIIKIVAQCLAKTNLVLNINLANNYHETDYDALPNWEYIFLDAKTFEEEINTREDCYTVLEKILGFQCYMQQHNNEWWIMNYDEYVNGVFYYWKFDDQGDYVSAHTAGTTLKDDIEHNVLQTITDGVNFFSQEDQEVKLTRPHKATKLTYRFEYPREIPSNLNFERGTFISPLSVPPGQAFTIEDWTLLRDNDLTVTTQGNSYIWKVYDDGYERNRYAVILRVSGDLKIVSERIPVIENDKFDCSVDARYNTDVGGSGAYSTQTIQVRLYGDNSTYWTVDDDGNWVASNSTFSINNQYITETGDLSEDQTEWKTSSVEARPIPATGEIEIRLIHNSASASERYFSNLRFTYIPYINGSYQEYNGLAHIASQTGNYKALLDEQVYVSDGPNKLTKGAMFKYDGSNYVLTEDWHNGWIYHGLPPAYEMPFGRLQALAVWNQYFREFRIISGSVQGIFNRPDSIPIWQMLMPSSYTGSNRYFFLMNFEIDVKMCEWKGTFAEFYDSSDDVSFTGEGKALDLDDMEVKYIS